MNSLALLDVAKLTSPNPVSLVCSRTPAGVTNLGTVSWWTYLSLEPAAIGFAMAKTSYTGEMVRAGKRVVLTIPGETLAKQVMQCGSSTGRTTDKARDFNIELTDIPDCDIRIPVGSVAAIECSLREYVDVGDHYFYICDVRKAYGDESKRALFAWKGYAKIAPASCA
ncbi:MAG: flavin reductase family protein [Desulfovibrionaceae bacterium]|nr:flavin reductase family protein [Desulfovibrionaceae bacterium]